MVGASPSGSAVVDSINNLDAGNPLHVQNSDNSNFVIIPFKLLGTEFGLVPGCYWLTGCKVLGGFDALTKLPKVDASKELGLHQELMKLMQFLMGLDDCYHPVRSSLLTRELLPKVKDAYIVVSREESHRGVYESSGVTESKLNATSFAAKSFNNNNSNNNNNNNRRGYNNSNNNTKGNLPSNRGPNPNLNCKHFGKIGHTIDRCFELVSFPNGFKRSSNSNTVKQGFNANADLKQNEKICSGNPSSGFTSEQMQKLLSLINETPSSSIHANMVVVLGYCVSLLSINKLIRDSTMFVGFDENLYSGKEKESGTGSESGGLYLFDKNNKCVIGKSNLVMSFHVSKSLWHSRLGHPANQVLSVLKNDLSVSKDTSVPGYEVYHKAKQTRKPFPLSDRKSKTLGELVHLDLWGPYGVPSREGFKYFLTIVDDYSRELYGDVSQNPQSSDDDGNDTSVVDGSLQPSFDTTDSSQGMYQEGWQSATQIDDQHWSEGNTHGLRRSSRQSKLPVKFNDYVLNSSVKYGIQKYVSYSKLKGSNLCFATTLNKSVEPTCLKDALSDANWVEAMNNDIEALNKNNTWTECDLPIGRKPIGNLASVLKKHLKHIADKAPRGFGHYVERTIDPINASMSTKFRIEKFPKINDAHRKLRGIRVEDRRDNGSPSANGVTRDHVICILLSNEVLISALNGSFAHHYKIPLFDGWTVDDVQLSKSLNLANFVFRSPRSQGVSWFHSISRRDCCTTPRTNNPTLEYQTADSKHDTMGASDVEILEKVPAMVTASASGQPSAMSLLDTDIVKSQLGQVVLRPWVLQIWKTMASGLCMKVGLAQALRQ
ncbi:ribonuclease H-like domain-containing protein [Tanacetum coccineum]|uniref:Ribonuclease H-like domain-containing protein n=1 Tax=Tanacetum coccineum TaxID=301880 RepID=A0ABQ5AJZ1_9ASTR